MTRSERLVYIIRLFQSGKKYSIDDIAQACNVSNRTAYRDLVTLKDLNFSIENLNGYVLRKSIFQSVLDLTDIEVKLIMASLQSSPFNSSLYLAQNIHAVEAKLTKYLKKNKYAGIECHFIYRGNRVRPLTSSQNIIVSTFIRAIKSCKNVKVILKDNSSNINNLMPCQVIAGPKEWKLSFISLTNSKSITYALKDISELRMINR